MEKRKIILLFSDLEGTILRESDGEYSNEDMNQFLNQIEKLQSLTGATVKMHLVSPVYPDQMESVMNKIDRSIIKYNRAHRESTEILEIEGGAAYPDDMIRNDDYNGDRITFLKKPMDEMDFDMAQYGKEYYVKQWCRVYRESENDELIFAIYCGNGRNDISAVKYINSLKLGLAVCPNNTRRELKARAFHVSEKTDLLGIAEGIAEINKEIEKRNKSVNEVESER